MLVNKKDCVVRVVDDDGNVRNSWKFLIEDAGWTVKTYPDAFSFLRGDDPLVPGCVLLDVRMPLMSGIELQRELIRRRNHLPVIFVSAHGDIDMAVKAVKDGASDFLPKPVKAERLLDAIDRAVGLDQKIRGERNETLRMRSLFNRLTPREKSIARMISQGRLNKQMAFDLEISEKTVQAHRSSMCKKLKVRNAADVTKFLMKINEHES